MRPEEEFMTLTTAKPNIPDDFHVRDLYSPDVMANPYPYYDHLRDKPIQFGLEDYPPGTIPGMDKPFPAWVVLRHADVQEVCRRADVFSSRDIMQEESEAPTLMLVIMTIRATPSFARSPRWPFPRNG